MVSAAAVSSLWRPLRAPAQTVMCQGCCTDYLQDGRSKTFATELFQLPHQRMNYRVTVQYQRQPFAMHARCLHGRAEIASSGCTRPGAGTDEAGVAEPSDSMSSKLETVHAASCLASRPTLSHETEINCIVSNSKLKRIRNFQKWNLSD